MKKHYQTKAELNGHSRAADLVPQQQKLAVQRGRKTTIITDLKLVI
jgi:hypothetical protein